MACRVTRRFRFEAAHRLWKDYSGKCAHNHGHSWTASVTVEADALDAKGMVVDYADLKALGAWIDAAWDHGTILWKEDPFLAYLLAEKHKTYACDANPTSEHLAFVLLGKARELFEDGRLRVLEVRVCETLNTEAWVG
ncbi:MAG: 6-carboxytetrahydropterin synthase [Spirochaetes bacterium]|nr:6-carboxytetrahydropterin synthase [Spirochaetota bacterium]